MSPNPKRVAGVDAMMQLFVSAEIADICTKARETAKEILLDSYSVRVAPFVAAIKLVQVRRHCSLADAALIVGCELNKTGHTTLLVFAAFADLCDVQVMK
jgi:hypothetical protein